MKPIGSIAELWRYPVKSMRGERIDRAEITGRGIVGDRAHAIIELGTGHVASAKHARKWGALLACEARFMEPPAAGIGLPPVEMVLPDGSVVRSDDPDVDGALSLLLGREVRLVAEAPPHPTREANRAPVDAIAGAEKIMIEPMGAAAPAGTFFDHAVIHLLTTATLRHLSALHPDGLFDARRFRPNIVVATEEDERGFAENEWLTRDLLTDEGVVLRVIDPTPRCVVTTLAQKELPHDPAILRTMALHNAVASATLAPGILLPAVAGVYADPVTPGMLRQGDGMVTG